MQVLRYLGITVLLWLAWKIGTARRASGGGRERPTGFLEAAGFQWVNPKAWLMCAAAVSGFLRDDSSALGQAAIIAGVFLLVGAPSSMAWLGFGAAMQAVLRSDRALRVFNITMGALLAATLPLLV
jgi:threonine/homoserine/homoserine lactone efflux protein